MVKMIRSKITVEKLYDADSYESSGSLQSYRMIESSVANDDLEIFSRQSRSRVEILDDDTTSLEEGATSFQSSSSEGSDDDVNDDSDDDNYSLEDSYDAEVAVRHEEEPIYSNDSGGGREKEGLGWWKGGKFRSRSAAHVEGNSASRRSPTKSISTSELNN